jgi:nitroimidazol reductase NimA-like FMN-containing flavoprotein (pyridoxamine 5'-phosphate oxidase superfamily)
MDPTPRLLALPRQECLRRLGRMGLGRVAVTIGALPAIFPVNYALLGDDVVFRMAAGTKLKAALRGTVVAFEVDRADALRMSGWSVLIIGEARAITDRHSLAAAMRLPLTSWAVGERDVFVRLTSTIVTGRELASADGWASDVPIDLTSAARDRSL